MQLSEDTSQFRQFGLHIRQSVLFYYSKNPSPHLQVEPSLPIPGAHWVQLSAEPWHYKHSGLHY